MLVSPNTPDEALSAPAPARSRRDPRLPRRPGQDRPSRLDLHRTLTDPACIRCDYAAILDGIEAMVFDFDGTVGDTTLGHEQALRAVLQEYSLDLDPDWYRQHVGLSIHDLLTELPDARQLPHDEIIRQSRAYLLATVNSITPIKCVVALLRGARHAGLPCAIASGASELLVQPGLAALGLTRQFAAIVTREDAARGKPAPDLYVEAARRLDIPPGRCLAVDDAPDGVTSARAAGMHVLTLVDGHLAPADDEAKRPGHLDSGAGPPIASGTPRRGEHSPAATDETALAPHGSAPESSENSTN